MAGRATKGRSPGAQAPSHAGNCQTGAVGEGSIQAQRQLTGPRSVGCLKGTKVRGETTVLFFETTPFAHKTWPAPRRMKYSATDIYNASPICKAVRPYASCIWIIQARRPVMDHVP